MLLTIRNNRARLPSSWLSTCMPYIPAGCQQYHPGKASEGTHVYASTATLAQYNNSHITHHYHSSVTALL